VRVFLRDSGRRIGVEYTAKLLEEGPELLWNGGIGDTVDFLDCAVDRLEVIGLTRLGTDAKVAGDIQKETH